MKMLISVNDVRSLCDEWRQQSNTISFVPTMGALHEGHLSLMREAKSRADKVIASIFVNPSQFGPNEDFSKYPRTLKDDEAKLADSGVDALYVPNAGDMYPDGFQTWVSNEGSSDILCGASRSGHFRGVLTVVLKLFNHVSPDFAVFGSKDYQQLALIRKMVEDLCLNIEILSGDIVRESDGLAMSSRNRNLIPEHRDLAPKLYQGLLEVEKAYKDSGLEKAKLIRIFNDFIKSSPEIEMEYCEVRSAKDLQDVEDDFQNSVVMLIAAKLGDVRLIDNHVLAGLDT
ncbi:MAG: pantoate--beta-alanine ligase [Zetaproteobacteria bacterium]|nr:pantoate--beta-alanine ligase [Pseudobdellovibrionaceae bacterium]